MENIPAYITIGFGLTTAVTVYLFYKAVNNSKRILAIVIAWLLLQSGIGLTGFYTVTSPMPPRFALLVVPPVLAIIVLLLTPKGRSIIDSWNIEMLTYIHIVRVPVELTLLGLFIYKQVPQLMTFEGRNFDIISGITAPLVAYLALGKTKLNKGFLLAWNILCLGLVLNIVLNAILSLPTPFQRFAFEQPNVGLAYFPFIWLPCFIVPVVLIAHIVSIRRIVLNKENKLAVSAA